jgi:RNA polymerase sigma-70 factor (ECF subfamily)
MTDDEVMRLAVAGDAPARTELVSRHRASVTRYLRRLTQHDAQADDLTQETFVTALAHLATWRGDGSSRGWLLSIARSQWLMSRRAPSSRHEPAEAQSLEQLGLAAGWGAPMDPEALTQRLEAHEVLDRALGALDVEAREGRGASGRLRHVHEVRWRVRCGRKTG